MSVAVRAELVLYVVNGSRACAAALRELDQILGRFRREQVEVTVRNVSEQSLRRDEPQVIVAPTLFMRSPHPEIMAGDVDEDLLCDLLLAAGVERA